ncbi:MAG: hypothetical protein CL678_03895 [Bdellovibrionaceae bacterium]|nr:hypothetical protein [Pseudobdellovibrionaceae bacterium]|tara:strand:- start:946 stop:1815 length:870 start_codon:yes stop_codon:yes gene_type:complete
MKILCDFDGVLTNQVEEALQVQTAFLQTLAAIHPEQAQGVETLYKRVLQVMNENPWRHGWVRNGRVSAFANEDLFIRMNGVASCLDQWAYEGLYKADAWKKALMKNEIGSFVELLDLSFQKMVETTQAEQRNPLDPEVTKVLKGLLSHEVEVVIVSNSSTSRIEGILKMAELEKLPIRIRGNAKKYELGNEPKTMEVGSYFVEVDRPFYQKILDEEKPQAVIGDVFSLDLALPLTLAQQSGEEIDLFLRKREYTPQWSQDWMENSYFSGCRLHVIDELSVLVQWAQGAS